MVENSMGRVECYKDNSVRSACGCSRVLLYLPGLPCLPGEEVDACVLTKVERELRIPEGVGLHQRSSVR